MRLVALILIPGLLLDPSLARAQGHARREISVSFCRQALSIEAISGHLKCGFTHFGDHPDVDLQTLARQEGFLSVGAKGLIKILPAQEVTAIPSLWTAALDQLLRWSSPADANPEVDLIHISKSSPASLQNGKGVILNRWLMGFSPDRQVMGLVFYSVKAGFVRSLVSSEIAQDSMLYKSLENVLVRSALDRILRTEKPDSSLSQQILLMSGQENMSTHEGSVLSIDEARRFGSANVTIYSDAKSPTEHVPEDFLDLKAWTKKVHLKYGTVKKAVQRQVFPHAFDGMIVNIMPAWRKTFRFLPNPDAQRRKEIKADFLPTGQEVTVADLARELEVDCEKLLRFVKENKIPKLKKRVVGRRIMLQRPGAALRDEIQHNLQVLKDKVSLQGLVRSTNLTYQMLYDLGKAGRLPGYVVQKLGGRKRHFADALTPDQINDLQNLAKGRAEMITITELAVLTAIPASTLYSALARDSLAEPLLQVQYLPWGLKGKKRAFFPTPDTRAILAIQQCVGPAKSLRSA